MGVRISWLTLARNSSLARLAASAASLARRSSSSARLRSVTSRMKAANRYCSPSADGGDADFGGELAAVAAQGRDLEDAVEQRPLAGRQEASQAAAVSFAELRGDDGFGQDAADRLGPRPAEGDLGLAVPLGDEAVGAHGDEGVVGVVEDEAPALLAARSSSSSCLRSEISLIIEMS